MEVNLTRQKELNAALKAVQQKEFVRQLKNVDGINADKHKICLF